jgi:hypothetical protein
VKELVHPFNCKYSKFSGASWLILTKAEDLLPEWHQYSLHPQLLRALHSKDFMSPTPIQAASLPFVLTDRDVIGIAQTVREIPLSSVCAYGLHRALVKLSLMVYQSFTTCCLNRNQHPGRNDTYERSSLLQHVNWRYRSPHISMLVSVPLSLERQNLKLPRKKPKGGNMKGKARRRAQGALRQVERSLHRSARLMSALLPL